MILTITDFEITSQNAGDNFSYIKLYINKSNFITIPFQTSSIQSEITDKLITFITQHKDVVINLSSPNPSNNSRLFQIKKDYFLLDFIYRESSSPLLAQETYLIGENNNVFRNAIRKFINDSYFTTPGQP